MATLQDLAPSYHEEVYPTCGPFESSEDLVLPEAYGAILAVVNGLEWDGHVADRDFATDKEGYDLLLMNAIWHDVNPTDFLYLGDSDMSWWVYDRQSQSYQELDKPSGELVTSFSSLDDFLVGFFASALGEASDDEA